MSFPSENSQWVAGNIRIELCGKVKARIFVWVTSIEGIVLGRNKNSPKILLYIYQRKVKSMMRPEMLP